MSKVKIGVIGVGVLGKLHAKLYKTLEEAEITGVYDVNPQTAEAVGQEFGIPVFTDMNALIDASEALSIAVPATNHHETAMAVLAKNKHLLIEKPLAATVPEAEEIVKVAHEKGLVLGVGHVERFNPAMKFLEKHAGKTRFIEAHRLAKYPPPRPGMHRRGTEVGVVLDLMIHDLDLVLNMVDSELERIDAVGIPVLSETEDIANVRLKFKNGTVANLTASRVSPDPMRKFRVFLTDAYISMDYANRKGMIYRKGKLAIAGQEVNLCETNALQEELHNFLQSVIHTRETGVLKEPKVPGTQGLNALKVAVMITNEINDYNKRYGVEFK